ncbi:MAG: L-aspartate oxidase [Liquorilactobacillus satsumensis]
MKKVVIVGAGLAGSYLAAHLPADCAVTLVTKKTRGDSNSMLAQGGIAVAVATGDSAAQHADDTLKAGKYHNNAAAVSQLVTTGPVLVKELLAQGMPFDKTSNGELAFGLEGAHSCHRILHAQGDQTGHALTQFVQGMIQNVEWKENTTVVDLLIANGECRGVMLRDAQGQLRPEYADFTVLATGGLGHLYPLTTNDATITGDGIALAQRNGVKLADMAYVQFHPTLLTKNGKCYGLITEAIRGAGAILVDENGTHIMQDFPQKDLAPRDVVTRQLKAWQQKGHQLFLDISAIKDFRKKFPGVSRNLDKHRINFEETALIPIKPGAHFCMGGIKTDLNAQTSLKRLFAIGEVACNGVHGANRLASNSLLDCLVSAHKAAATISTSAMKIDQTVAVKTQPAEPKIIPHLPEQTQLLEMAWKSIGVVRTKETLKEFLNWLARFNYQDLRPEQLSAQELSIANLCVCAELIANSALAQPRSLGANYIEGQ